MPMPTFNMMILGRRGGRSAQKQAAYGAGDAVKTVSTQSIVRSASYRAGEPLLDEQRGHTYDYSAREDVAHAEILTPEHAPEWAKERQALWNEVDRRETRADAQLARSAIIALPRELDLEQNIALLREYLQEEFVSKGMFVDFAVHVSDASDKGAEPKGLPFDGKNPHAHVLVGMRGFNADGTWHHYKNGGKDRPWNQYSAENKRFESMRPWRDAWEEMQNRHLAAAGSFARVSLQSYAARGIDQIPTVHMGYEEWQQHQQGLDTDTGRRNQEIREENARRQADRENAPTAAANDNRVTAHTRDSVRAPEKDAGRRSAPPPPSRETPDAQAQRAAHAASPDRETARDGPDARAGVEDRQPQAPPRRTGQQGAAGHAQRRWMADTMAGWQRYWERQAERLERYQAAFDGKALYAKLKGAFARGKTAEKESPEEKEKEEARQKPRRVWSAEQRADYQMLRPYLQQHADLSKKEQAHLQAVVMHYAQQKRAQERRVELERIARQQAAFRQRAITQDRPLPHQARERTRGRGR